MLEPIKDIASLTDPLKKFMFRLVIAEMKGGVVDPYQFYIRCTAYTLPGLINIDQTVTNLVGFERHDAGIQRRGGDWTTSVVETWSADILQEFQNWCSIYHDLDTGIIHGAADYKTSAVVQQLGGNNSIQKEITLHGLFPVTVGSPNNDPNSSDPVTYDITWRYDWWD